MDTFQPFVALSGLGINISSAKALIEAYNRELSEVDALITRVEDDKRGDERVLRSSKEAMRLQLQRQIDDLWAQESVEAEQLEATYQARRAPLDERRTSILANIDGVKHSIAPIRNIPTEILGYIFREVVALDVAPWLLTIVNKSWRRTALTNPWLWSNIRLGGLFQEHRSTSYQSEWLVDGIPRTCHGNGLVCRNLDELAYFVDKSGVVPLDVWAYSGVKSKDEWVVLKRLLGLQLSSRLRSLSISFSMEPEGASEWILGPFPLLQKLSCGSSRGSFIERVMAQAHQLKNLTTTSLPHDTLKYPFWKTLRTLDLGDWADASKLNQVITDLQLIEVIEGSPANWPNIDTPIVTLQYLKYIDLTCHLQHIACLRLPRLEKMVWYDDFFSYNYAENLDFSTDPDWRLSLPNLVEIQACAAGEAFTVALRELPNVHTAFLEPTSSKNAKDAWALDLIQSLTEAEDMLCPKLRHLTLNLLTTNKTLAKPLIRRLIISRKALGIPFKHLEIMWAKRSGKNEEVVQYV